MSVAQPLVQASLVGEAIDRGRVAVFVADDELPFSVSVRLADPAADG